MSAPMIADLRRARRLPAGMPDARPLRPVRRPVRPRGARSRRWTSWTPRYRQAHGRRGVPGRVRAAAARLRRPPTLLYDATRLSGAGRRADPAQAGGPQPHRRPQGPQRARPGAADQADGQDAGHRRDRGRPARRGQRDRRGAASAWSAWSTWARRTPAGRRSTWPGCGCSAPTVVPVTHRLADAQGRHQRGAARLGDQRRQHPLPARHRRRPAPVPGHGARLRPRHRRGGAARSAWS